MEPGPLRDVLTLGLGLATGAMSAAFGVGGATISTPGIRALGAPAFVAVGTTLPSMLPSAASGTARYTREGLVEWWAVRAAAPVGVVVVVLSSLLSHVVPGEGHLLMVFTAALLAVTAVQMARHLPPGGQGAEDGAGAEDGDRAGDDPRQTRWRNSRLAAAAAGATSGLLSGLLGIGGGIVLVPAFSEVVGMPTKVAVATSLVCVGIFAVPGTIAHAFLGDIDWRFALLLAVAVVPGARLGAALAIRTSARRMRLSLAVVLGVISVVYAAGEIAALR